MGDSIDDFGGRLCELCYKLTTITCPGSIENRDQVFFDGWLAFLMSLYRPARNPTLNLLKQFAVDMLVPYKSRIKEYNKDLMQANNTGFSPILEKWPTLSETYLSRLSLWLVKDINFRFALANEYSLELDPEIVDHVMGWKKRDREKILNKAKSVFKRNYKFLQESISDYDMPKYLLSALLDEDLKVPSCRELILIKTDIEYCHNLIKIMSKH